MAKLPLQMPELPLQMAELYFIHIIFTCINLYFLFYSESDDNPKEITTKIPRSKKNARVSDLAESSNVEVAGLQSKSPDKSASMHDSSASQRVQSLVNSVEESGSFIRSSRKRTGLSNQNELECGVNFESTVKTPISSRSKFSFTILVA
jgi:hypothetical protein